MSASTSQQLLKWGGIITALAAGATLLRTFANLEDPRKKNTSSGSCCSGSSSSSSSQYVTAGSDPKSNPYETQQSVYEYLLMHYGTQQELMNFPKIQSEQLQASMNFPRECAEALGKYASSLTSNSIAASNGLRALDIGCSVGRSSFELTRFAQEVIGLDYSQAFIDAANTIQRTGSASYTMRTEGDLVQSAVARVDPSLDRSRVKFVQGDACNLLATFPSTKFHLVLAANLLCRLPFPSRFLETLPKIIVEGGILVMPSPYTWLEQYTPKEEWIGGFVKNGKEVKSFEGIKARLSDTGFFTLVEQYDLPFFIRETARKNQWSVSHVTVWKRTNKQAQ